MTGEENLALNLSTPRQHLRRSDVPRVAIEVPDSRPKDVQSVGRERGASTR